MTDLPAEESTPEPEKPAPRSKLMLGLGALVVVVLLAGFLVYRLKSGGIDSHARAACDTVKKVNAGTAGLFDGAILEITAIAQARKSSDAELKGLATTDPDNAGLDTSSPLYVNPGDYEYNKIAQWCAVHG